MCVFFLTNSIYIYNNFVFYFDKKLQREESHISGTTLNSLALMLSFLDKRKKYACFLAEAVPILDLLCQVHEKQGTKVSYLLAKFYISLFVGNDKNRLNYLSSVKCESKMSSFFYKF